MELKDCLHLYLGSHLQVEYGHRGTKKIGILTGYDEVYGWQIFRPDVALAPYLLVRDDLIKPILHLLSDATDEEAQFIKFRDVAHLKKKIIEDSEPIFWSGKEFLFLLSKHFDLFGLIESGLAIDKTKI